MSNRWNKYNVKSTGPPRGKEGSEYYGHLLKFYGPNEADERWREFKYKSTHGIKTQLTNKYE